MKPGATHTLFLSFFPKNINVGVTCRTKAKVDVVGFQGRARDVDWKINDCSAFSFKLHGFVFLFSCVLAAAAAAAAALSI
jgi:hypothetical protein